MRSKQSGMTLIGFILLLIVLAFVAYAGMKLVPPYMHYMGVSEAMEQVASEGAEGKSQHDIRQSFMFKLDFQYASDTISGDDIEFERKKRGLNMTVDYDEQVPFVANIDFLLHFHKSILIDGKQR